MRVRIEEGERYPTLQVEVDELAAGDPGAQQRPNVPPELVNALQKAERELLKAEHAILKHLFRTEQYRVIKYSEDGRNMVGLEHHTLFHSLEQSQVERWLTDLDETIGRPVAAQPLQCGHVLTEGPHEGERCMLVPGHKGVHV